MWEWKNEKGDYITSQMRYLGASADWTRGRFTMDEDMSASVAEARPPLGSLTRAERWMRLSTASARAPPLAYGSACGSERLRCLLAGLLPAS